MASDGKVVISTELDNSGFEKGIKTISGQLGGLGNTLTKIAAMLAAAFSAKKIIEFATESAQAARTMADALTGLKSILEGQGRSFSDAQDFIEEYVEDGLIPATNAINAYKNLASRGYDDGQIKQVMTALKDASAYGRQASYTMGEAVESATEGLKDENSILVDNAGVTKNVAKMWDEYAVSIGTTANNLTQQQKIQAEVSGILAETKYQTGDAATVAGTLSGQLQQLSFNFNNLKIAVGNAINPFIQTVLPIINSVVVAFTRLTNAVATVVGILFGKATVQAAALAEQNDSVASSANAGAEAERELANNTKAAGKAAKKALASFDELNVLQFGSGGSDSSSAPSAATPSRGTTSTGIEVEDTISSKLQAISDKIRELIEPLKQIDFTPVVEAFGQLKEAIAPLTTKLFEGLEWAWYNILVPLAEWTIEDVLPAFLDLLSAALGLLNAAIEGLEPMGQWLWDKFLKPLAEWTGGVIIDTINGFADALKTVSDWISSNQGMVQAMTVTVAAFVAAWKIADVMAWIINAGGLITVLKNIASAVYSATAAKLVDKATDMAIIALYAVDYIKAFGTMIAQLAASTASWVANTAAKVASTAAEWAQIAATTAWNAICTTATAITTAFGAAINFLASPIGLVVLAIGALIAIIVLLVKNWDSVKNVAANVWNSIKSVWDVVANWFRKYVTEPIGNFFKNMVNGIIGFINGMISTVVSGVNFIIRALNKLSFNVPDWVPLIGGQTWGFNISEVTAPQIPYLAKGAVLPANKPFLAMVGDQKHGTNIEAPLSTIQEAVAEVMADYEAANLAGHEATVETLRQILSAVLAIEVGDTTIGQAANRFNQKMAIIKGGL